MARILLRDLMQNRAYKVQVRAVSDRETGEWSRLFDLQTDLNLQAPDVPSFVGVGGFVADGTAFTATWNALNMTLPQNLDFDRYELELTANSKSVIFKTTNTTFTLTFEQNKTVWGTAQPSFSARLRAVDQSGNVSAWAGPTVASNALPEAPATIIASAASDQISLKWDASIASDVTTYRVYVGSTSGFTPSNANKIFEGNSLAFSYTTTSYGVSQWFKVAAVDVFGQPSVYTSTSAAVSPTSPFVIDNTPPVTPTGFSVTITNEATGIESTQRANATWTYDTNDTSIAGFNIRYKKSGTVGWTNVVTVKDPVFPYLVATGLPANVAYDFELRSFDIFANKTPWVALSTNAVTPTVDPTLFYAIQIAGGGYIESAGFNTGTGYRLTEDGIYIYEGSIQANVITTGILHSSEPAVDEFGNDVPGEYAWQMDLEGDAVFGNVKVRGNLTVGAGGSGIVSVMQSGNYSPGETGWILRSDGTGQLLSLGAETINAESLVLGTLSAAAFTDDSTLGASSIIRLQGILQAEGNLGELVSMGAEGFQVIGSHETNVVSKSLTSNVVTLNTEVAHGYAVGSEVIVSNVGTPFPSTPDRYTILGVPSATSLTISMTGTDFTTTTVTGLVQGRDVSGTRAQPLYIDFPTDGSKPNIISGVLTASTLVVTGSANFRGTSVIDPGGKLVISAAITAPTTAPGVAHSYNDKVFTGYTGTFKWACRAPNGNMYVLGQTVLSGQDAAVVTEHNVVTGLKVATVLTEYGGGGGNAADFTSIAVVNNRLYMVQRNTKTNYDINFDTYHSQDYINTYNISGSTATFVGQNVFRQYINNDKAWSLIVGTDYSNTSRLIVAQSGSKSSYDNSNKTAGIITIRNIALLANGRPSGDPNTSMPEVSNNSITGTTAARQLGFVARGTFDLGADRYIVKTREYSTASVDVNYLSIDPTTSAGVANEHWPLAFSKTIAGGWWDTTASQFFGMTSGGNRLQFAAGDSKWSGTDYFQQRWVSYSWLDPDTAGTVVPATGAATHETNLGAVTSFKLAKRAYMNVTIAPIPKGIGSDTPTTARIWVANATVQPALTSSTWKLRPTISYPSTSAQVNPYQSIGSTVPKTTNEFSTLSTDLGLIQNDTGSSYWKGDGTAQFTAPVLLSGADWITLAIASPYTAIASPQNPEYRKDAAGTVWVRGAVTKNTATTGQTVFTLPQGYRPSKNVYQVCRSGVAGQVAQVIIDATTGVGILTWTGTPTTFGIECSFTTL